MAAAREKAPPVKSGLPFFVRTGISLLFFLSGAVALIYEAAWQREFSHLFGSAAPATSAVLAAYFAGLGLGSWIFGKLSDRFHRPLLIYAVLELAIGVGALLVSPLLNLYATFYPELFARFQGHASFLWLKGLLAFLSIAIPTFAMGGTLPILAKLFESDRIHFGRSAGWLYFLNTIGAATGVLSFPFLFASFGLQASTQVCAAANFIIAVFAFALSRKVPLFPPTNRSTAHDQTSPRSIRLCLALAFISGFATFFLQVAWNRAFAQVHENSIHSFTLIVALFIVAIALGAQISRFLLRRGLPWRRALGVCWILAAFFLLLSPAIFIYLTDGLRFLPDNAVLFNPRLLLPATVLIIPVALIAVSLPLLFQALASHSKHSVADLTGRTLALNIAGSVFGALAAGFVFPRYLGLWNSMLLCAALIAATAFAILIRTRVPRFISMAITAAIAFSLSRSDLPRTRIEPLRHERLVRLLEGAHGIVAVIDRGAEETTSRRLKLNNHYILGGTSATGDERLQGHIPLLLHPKAGSVAFLGYGTGITASSVLFHSVSNVVALELVPEVVQVARDYFFDSAFSEKYPVVIEDARNYLRGTTNTFDILIGDLVVPWRAGEGALYTLENFQAARRRLNDSGLYCCWLPLFQLSREDFDLIARTFQKVFPHVQVWRGDFSPTEPALALVGSVNPIPLAKPETNRMQPDPANPHLQHPAAFWMHFVGPLTNIPAGPLNLEDRPVIELRSRQPIRFVGRPLAEWEGAIRAQSAHLEKQISADQRAGWDAGALMREFTLLLSENRHAEAEKVAQQIRSMLGNEVAPIVLGP